MGTGGTVNVEKYKTIYLGPTLTSTYCRLKLSILRHYYLIMKLFVLRFYERPHNSNIDHDAPRVMWMWTDRHTDCPEIPDAVHAQTAPAGDHFDRFQGTFARLETELGQRESQRHLVEVIY